MKYKWQKIIEICILHTFHINTASVCVRACETDINVMLTATLPPLSLSPYRALTSGPLITNACDRARCGVRLQHIISVTHSHSQTSNSLLSFSQTSAHPSLLLPKSHLSLSLSLSSPPPRPRLIPLSFLPELIPLSTSRTHPALLSSSRTSCLSPLLQDITSILLTREPVRLGLQDMGWFCVTWFVKASEGPAVPFWPGMWCTNAKSIAEKGF